jgi:hypothetical protein
VSPERAIVELGPAGSHGFVSVDGAFFSSSCWLYMDLLLVMNTQLHNTAANTDDVVSDATFASPRWLQTGDP